MTFDSWKWVGAEAEYSEHPLLIRFREIPKPLPKSKYPERVNIFWKLSEQDGEKEFIFQTTDVPGFMSRLTDIPQDIERYPITIHRFYDPNWDYFESVIPKTS